MKAMIYAAGLGSRLKPITDAIPKALVPVAGAPLLEHVVGRLKEAGVEEIIINVHHFPDQIIDFLKAKNNFGIRIEVSNECQQLLDTGGGLKNASSFFDDGKPFIVHNVDILSNIDLKEIYNTHLKHQHNIASLVVTQRSTNRYLLFDKHRLLRGWVNTLTGETKPVAGRNGEGLNELAFAGIQVVSPAVFRLMKNEEDIFSIIDFYLRVCHLHDVMGITPVDAKVLDVGKIKALQEAESFAL